MPLSLADAGRHALLGADLAEVGLVVEGDHALDGREGAPGVDGLVGEGRQRQQYGLLDVPRGEGGDDLVLGRPVQHLLLVGRDRHVGLARQILDLDLREAGSLAGQQVNGARRLDGGLALGRDRDRAILLHQEPACHVLAGLAGVDADAQQAGLLDQGGGQRVDVAHHRVALRHLEPQDLPLGVAAGHHQRQSRLVLVVAVLGTRQAEDRIELDVLHS